MAVDAHGSFHSLIACDDTDQVYETSSTLTPGKITALLTVATLSTLAAFLTPTALKLPPGLLHSLRPRLSIPPQQHRNNHLHNPLHPLKQHLNSPTHRPLNPSPSCQAKAPFQLPCSLRGIIPPLDLVAETPFRYPPEDLQSHHFRYLLHQFRNGESAGFALEGRQRD